MRVNVCLSICLMSCSASGVPCIQAPDMRESGGGNKVVSMTVCGVFGCWFDVHFCNRCVCLPLGLCVIKNMGLCGQGYTLDKITCGDWYFVMFFPEANEVGSCLLGGSDVTPRSVP